MRTGRTPTARIAVALAAVAAAAIPSPARAADPANPWLARRILNIAHQGGENEAPSNTMFAFTTALRKGGDVLELDVHATADRQIVVLHDATADRTTNGTGRIDQMTLQQVRRLDAAYWFVPGCGTCHDRPVEDYVYRGFATRQRPIPRSLGKFRPTDFAIPTLREVLRRFPNQLINIEIKETAPDTEPYEELLADLLIEFGRSSDTIVVSFFDNATETFKTYAPDVHTAPGTAGVARFRASSEGALPGAPVPGHVALQVPIEFEGVTVVTQDFVNDAHANGLAVHVWTINTREEMELLIDWGVDGIMTDVPTLLEQVLTERGVRWVH